jgi:hypothetical protein
MELTISAALRGSALEITHTWEGDEYRSSLANEMSRRICDFEDRLVREALIKLGWTPPEDTTLRDTQHELAILHDAFKLYPGAWCCAGARHSNGWHHRLDCKNYVICF